MSRARPATIRRSDIPTVSISRSARTAPDSAPPGVCSRVTPPRLVKRNSQTVLNVAFNGLTAGARRRAGGRADVLGSQGPQPRSAGAGAAQGAATRCAATRIPRTARLPAVVVATERHPGVPPAVCPRVRRTRKPVNEQQPRTRARGVRADARRRQFAVRSLHARRHDGAQSRAGARHGAVPVGGLRQLPQRPDVLGFRHSRARRARQPQAVRTRIRA